MHVYYAMVNLGLPLELKNGQSWLTKGDRYNKMQDKRGGHLVKFHSIHYNDQFCERTGTGAVQVVLVYIYQDIQCSSWSWYHTIYNMFVQIEYILLLALYNS